MDDSLATVEDPGKSMHNQRDSWKLDGKVDKVTASKTALTQTICILVFRGYPRDSESARMVDFCILTDNNHTDTTYRLVGHRGSYGLSSTPGQGNIYARPHFLRKFHVADVAVSSENDTRLHDLIKGTSIHNENLEWTRWTWIDNILGALTAAGVIPSDEAIEIIDATIDCVTSAPYPD